MRVDLPSTRTALIPTNHDADLSPAAIVTGLFLFQLSACEKAPATPSKKVTSACTSRPGASEAAPASRVWLSSWRRRRDPILAPTIHAEWVGLALKLAGPHFPACVLCGSGQQHPRSLDWDIESANVDRRCGISGRCQVLSHV